MTRVRRTRSGIELRFTEGDAAIVATLTAQVASLLRADDADDADDAESAEGAPGDDLEAMVAMSVDPVAAPEDPAVQRLLPDAYADADAAGEFRRLMEEELRRDKVAALEQVAATAERGGTVVLDPDAAETWLRALNDVRLVVGVRLDVTEDPGQFRDVTPADPRLPLLVAYDRLTWLQDTLVNALDG